jgi:hypothetical protein
VELIVIGNKSRIATFDAKPVIALLKQRAQLLEVAGVARTAARRMASTSSARCTSN